MRACVLALYLGLLAASAPRASTLHVCPDGLGDYPNLSAAVAAASNGDIVELCDGVFTGPGNVDVDVGTRSLTIRSVAGYDATTIDAVVWDPVYEEYVPHRGFLVGAATVRFEGITIARAGALENRDWVDGGAIHCVGGALTLAGVRIASGQYLGGSRGTGIFLQSGTLRAEDCDFVQNRASDYGGAVFAEGSYVELIRCHFSGNAACGGGACAYMTDGVVDGCVVEGGGGGPCDGANPGGNAFNIRGGRAVILRTRIADCHHTSGGGIVTASTANVEMDGCLIEECSADVFAGGAALGGSVTVRNTTFRANMGAWGGGTDIHHYGGTLLVEHCSFERTQVPGPLGGSSVKSEGHATLRNCTFVGQDSYSGSATIDVQEGAEVSIENTIIAFGGHGGAPQTPIVCAGTTEAPVVHCTDIYGNVGGDWVGCVEGRGLANGNLSADPLFCDFPDGDLRLFAASPCAPAHSGDCGLIGAYGVGCGTTALQSSTWGQIKGQYR